MLAQVFEECLVLHQRCFEPGQIGCVDVLVGYEIPGFRHSERVSVGDNRFQGLTFDISIDMTMNALSVGCPVDQLAHLRARFEHRLQASWSTRFPSVLPDIRGEIGS